MLLELRFARCDNLVLADPTRDAGCAGIEATFSIGRGCAITSAPRMPKCTDPGRVVADAASKMSASTNGWSIGNSTIFNEAMLLCLPNAELLGQLDSLVLKVVLWERRRASAARDEPHGVPAPECLGILKVKLADVLLSPGKDGGGVPDVSGFFQLHLHPRRNKRERSAHAASLNMQLGTLTMAIYSSQSVDVPAPSLVFSGAELLPPTLPDATDTSNTASTVEALVHRERHRVEVARPLLAVLGLVLSLVDLLAWRRPAKSALSLVILLLMTYWRMYDITMLLLLFATGLHFGKRKLFGNMQQQQIARGGGPGSLHAISPFHTLTNGAQAFKRGDVHRKPMIHGGDVEGEQYDLIQGPPGGQAHVLRLFSPHCRTINTVVRAYAYASVGHPVLSLTEVRLALTLLHRLSSSFRMMLVMTWVLYIVLGCDEILALLACTTFIVVPLYLRSPHLIRHLRRTESRPFTLTSVTVLSTNCIPTQTPRSSRNPRSASASNRAQSARSGTVDSEGVMSAPQGRAENEGPPLQATRGRSTGSVMHQLKQFALVTIDCHNSDECQQLIEHVAQLYRVFDGQGERENGAAPSAPTTDAEQASEMALHTLGSIRPLIKVLSLYLSLPNSGAGGDLAGLCIGQEDYDSPTDATNLALENFFQGTVGFQDGGLDTNAANWIYTLSNRVGGCALIESGEGGEVVAPLLSGEGSSDTQRFLVRIRPSPMAAAPIQESIDVLQEAKGFALIGSYWLQARKLAMFQPQTGSAARIVVSIPLTLLSQPSWSVVSPCPRKYRDALETIWKCPPYPPGASGGMQSTNSSRAASASRVLGGEGGTEDERQTSADSHEELAPMFTLDTVLAMLDDGGRMIQVPQVKRSSERSSQSLPPIHKTGSLVDLSDARGESGKYVKKSAAVADAPNSAGGKRRGIVKENTGTFAPRTKQSTTVFGDQPQ